MANVPNRPTVFISYRRDPNADLARYIYEHLSLMGVDAFFDIEDINGGHLDTIIEDQIIKREYFLLILAPQTLDSAWVRRELEIALKHGKNIVPLETLGFNFDQHVPAEFAKLKHLAGIPHHFTSPEMTFKRLAKALKMTSATTTVSAPVIPKDVSHSTQQYPIGLILTVTLAILAITGLFIVAPRLFSAAAPTLAPTSLEAIHTSIPTVTFSPVTNEPTATLIPKATRLPTLMGLPIVTATMVCPNSANFAIGDSARVLPGKANNLREHPDANARIMDQIPAGDVVVIRGGPECGDGYIWWQVKYGNRIGWTAQGDNTGYWLEKV